MAEAEPTPQGLLLVDKPSGPTSHDVVAEIRRLTGQRRVGHAGTLDPMASGLLPLCLGRVTRLVRFLPSAPKVYEGALELGVSTLTDDVTGEVLFRHDGPLPDPEAVRRAAGALTGRIRQLPPAVSARKVGGQRLYRLARAGRTVDAPAAEVEVRRFELFPTDRPDRWSFVAEVSSGTYIRALARDLGRIVGTGGVLAALRRTAIGPLRVADASSLDSLRRRSGAALEALVAPEDMPLVPPSVTLAGPGERRTFLAGGAVSVGDDGLGPGPRRVLDASGALLGIGVRSGDALRPKVVVAADPAAVARPSSRVLSSRFGKRKERD